MSKHLVFVGGGHAHLTALLSLEEFRKSGAQVTLVSAAPYHYYSGMGPGMLSGLYRPQDVRFHVRRMAENRGASFVEDVVTLIDPEERMLFLRSGGSLRYDLVSFNTGSDIPLIGREDPEENIFTVKPVVNLLKARNFITEKMAQGGLKVSVIGGGPAGVEVAGNVWRIAQKNKGNVIITMFAGTRLLNDLQEKARLIALESLAERGISVIEGQHVKRCSKGRIALHDSADIPFDVAFLATGVRPSSFFRDSGLPIGADGGLLVNACLQSVRYPEIFGGGDCISLEGHRLAKVGVYAVRENPVLMKNLLASLRGEGRLITFTPQRDYLLILNMGNDHGMLWRRHIVWEGRSAFILKDYIDRRFMRKFQVSGEPDEDGE
ncbi:MAG TPA: FAD-dependent oxidoreductase [Thermodesulfovibrionales bacterium]|nr:FAD-dependent oxidoreductase [Thermodesulfovibrionales bacterium]